MSGAKSDVITGGPSSSAPEPYRHQENHMNPQGIFHEVRTRYKKRENSGYAGAVDMRVQSRTQWAKPESVHDHNARRGFYPRNQLPGMVQQKHWIVKENKSNQNANKEAEQVSADSGNEQVISDTQDKSFTEKAPVKKYSASNSNGPAASQVSNGLYTAVPGHANKPSVDHRPEQSEGTRSTLLSPRAVVQKAGQSNSIPGTSATTNSAVELCCSSSDPIHVPSPGSRSAGSVGAIRREVGVVGARRQSFANTTTSNSSSSVPSKENGSSVQHPGHSGAQSKNSRFNRPTSSENRSFSSGQYAAKSNLQSGGNQKAATHLEWKPKSSRNSNFVNHSVDSSAPSVNPSADLHQVEMSGLSEKLSQTNVFDEHVIIPEHLRVSESEQKHFIFGTVGSGNDSSKGFMSASERVVVVEQSNDQPASSIATPIAVTSSENLVAHEQGDLVDSQVRNSPSDSAVSASEHEQPLLGNTESLSPQDIGEYSRGELNANHHNSYGSPQLQHQDNANLQNFKAYESNSRYAVPFITSGVGDNGMIQDSLPAELLSSHPANMSQLPMSAAAQQPMAQVYPQQVQQYPNFLPYRQMYSPVYVPPPIAVPNYSGNPAYAQPPHGSSYLVMPNGTSHLTANGVKYATPQYKPMYTGSPAGYGTYSNQNGYTIGSGTVGSPGTLEDVNRMKYKDNNLYMPNPQQAEAADMWIQTPRDYPNFPSSPFYSITGQGATTPGAYMPTHNGHAPYNAAPQAPHLQYPGMPHNPQAASMALIQTPHNMVHQQVPQALAGNVGVGVAAVAPGAQVGAFQQNQLNHLGWTTNF